VINPIPPINENKRTVGQRYLFDLSTASNRDTVETIDTMDMKEFVECCIKNIKILNYETLKIL
jgi:hypothetical protein